MRARSQVWDKSFRCLDRLGLGCRFGSRRFFGGGGVVRRYRCFVRAMVAILFLAATLARFAASTALATATTAALLAILTLFGVIVPRIMRFVRVLGLLALVRME